MIHLPTGVFIESPPAEVRDQRTIRSLLTRIRGLYEALEERFGEAGLDLIRDVSRNYGADIGRRLRGESAAWPLEEVGKLLVRVFSNINGEGEISAWNDRRIEIKVVRCVYPFRSDPICRAHTCMEEELVRALNPNLVYEVEKSLPRGDECCLHVVKR